MKVVLLNPEAPNGRHHDSLTITREYVVLGISAGYYRLLNDGGEPVLFDSACFRVIDPTEPAFWVSEFGEEGERYAHPPDWGVPGFFEDWHDGVEGVRIAFAFQLARWYPDLVGPP